MQVNNNPGKKDQTHYFIYIHEDTQCDIIITALNATRLQCKDY